MTGQKKLGAIILAAGKGRRMNSGKVNKVTLPLAGKPLILHSVHLLESMKLEQIVVVVGFAKESVKDALKHTAVTFVDQKKQMGTAHAVGEALSVLSPLITDVLVLYGDDSHFYNEKVISGLRDKHYQSKAKITFLTLNVADPSGLGRVIRDKNGEVVSVIEDKDANSKTKKINEINSACYIFEVSFLKKYIKKIKKSKVTGEYYLTSIIDIAVKNSEPINTFKPEKILWRGVNTKKELLKAEEEYKKLIG